MGHAEERRHAKDLGQIGTEAGEHEIGQQNLLLHLTRDVVHSTGVRQVQQRPTLRERGVKVVHDCHRGVFRKNGER